MFGGAKEHVFQNQILRESVCTRHHCVLTRFSVVSIVANDALSAQSYKSAYKKYEIMIISGALIVSSIKHVMYRPIHSHKHCGSANKMYTRLLQVGY